MFGSSVSTAYIWVPTGKLVVKFWYTALASVAVSAPVGATLSYHKLIE